MRNWIRSKRGILNSSEAAFQSHLLSNICKENTFKKESIEKTTD